MVKKFVLAWAYVFEDGVEFCDCNAGSLDDLDLEFINVPKRLVSFEVEAI